MSAVEIQEKHALVNRWSHWVNFPILFLMMWSGLLIYWAHGIYRIGWGDHTLFQFFPRPFYAAFHVNNRLAEGMAIHFILAWLFVINGLFYVAYVTISRQWPQILPDRRSFVQALQVTLYDVGLRKEMPRQGKYNGAQKIAYTATLLMGAGSVVTGLAIYRPTQLAWLDWSLGGYPAARMEHFMLTIGFVVFFLVHVAQVIRAGYNNFRSMVSGFEVVAPEKVLTHD